MTLGDQTVTFVAITEGTADRLGVKAPVRTPVAVPGCLFRALSTEETLNLTDVAGEVWKCTAPPVAAVLAAKATGEVKHADVTYQIVGGVQPQYDLAGDVDHVVVMCKKQTV